MDELQPQTLRERNLVEMMAVEWWHLGQCEFMRQSFFANQRKMVVDYHANWAILSEPERTKLVGENIAFYHLKDMNRISELKNRVFRSYHRASREFDRARDERLRRAAEPQPLPQLAEAPGEPAEPEPAPTTTPTPPAPTGTPTIEPAGAPAIPDPSPAATTNICRITRPNLPGEAPRDSGHTPGGRSTDRPAIDD
jgi:hypothetical protein